jgi:hypothetical protein
MGYIVHIDENVATKPPAQLLHTNKNIKKESKMPPVVSATPFLEYSTQALSVLNFKLHSIFIIDSYSYSSNMYLFEVTFGIYFSVSRV